MSDGPSLFEQAATALERAMKASGVGEQARLLDEAMRLNQLAIQAERAKRPKVSPASEPSASASDNKESGTPPHADLDGGVRDASSECAKKGLPS